MLLQTKMMAVKHGYHKRISYYNVSMGQGQDIVAMFCLDTVHRNVYWVILKNIDTGYTK